MPKTKKAQKVDTHDEERWSGRSQHSLIEEHRLKTELLRQRRLKESCESRIAALDKDVDQLAQIQAREGPLLRSRTASKLAELEVEKRLLEAHGVRVGDLEAQLAKMQEAILSGQGERAKNQGKLATLAEARLATDRRLAGVVDRLLGLLAQRDGETEKIRELAGLIDLSLAGDVLDEARFQGLHQLLPEKLLEKSAGWVRWFLGEPRETRPLVVTEETFTLPETLASAHFYKRGESVALTPEEHARMFPPKPSTSKAEAEAAFLAPAPQANEVDRWWAS